MFFSSRSMQGKGKKGRKEERRNRIFGTSRVKVSLLPQNIHTTVLSLPRSRTVLLPSTANVRPLTPPHVSRFLYAMLTCASNYPIPIDSSHFSPIFQLKKKNPTNRKKEKTMETSVTNLTKN
jgi:hypothetical protein